MKYRNNLLTGITLLVLALLFAILYLKPLADFFQLTSLNDNEMAVALGVSAISVLWFEVYKWIKRNASKQHG